MVLTVWAPLQSDITDRSARQLGITNVSDRNDRVLGYTGIANSGFTGVVFVEDMTATGDMSYDRFWTRADLCAFDGTYMTPIESVGNRKMWDTLRTISDLYAIALTHHYYAGVMFESAPPAATQNVAARLRLPAGSNVDVVITRLEITCNTARQVSFFVETAIQAALANALNLFPKCLPGFATVATATWAGNAAAGGGNLIHRQRLVAGVPYVYDAPIGMAQPSSFAVYFDDATNAVTDRMTLNLELFHTALGVYET